MTTTAPSETIARTLPRRVAVPFALALAMALFALSSAPDANAGGRHHGGYYGGGYKHGYYGPRRHHRHYRHRHHRSHYYPGAYFIGGLALGAIINHAYTRSYDPVVGRETRVIDRSPSRVTRSLYRDRDGRCFERTRTRDGDELLSELDPDQCAW